MYGSDKPVEVAENLLDGYLSAVEEMSLIDAIDCTELLIELLGTQLACLQIDRDNVDKKEKADPNDESLKLPDEDIAVFVRDEDDSIRKTK